MAQGASEEGAGERRVELRILERDAAASALADELEALARAPADLEGSDRAEPGPEDRAVGRPLVLGLATGATMGPLFDELGRRCREGRVSFGRVRAFALDEYCGLPAAHPGRMRAELVRTLLAQVDLPPEQVAFPDVDGAPGSEALAARCDAYERALRAAGGVDLQLLGIGVNGHVAFNEPGSSRDSLTRRVHLAPGTRAAAAARFGGLEAVPSAALTQGLATIRRARRLRLAAFGPAKAEAVAALVSGRPDPLWPASLLADHPDLIVFADAEAASAVGPAR